jgi:hypothetical protein
MMPRQRCVAYDEGLGNLVEAVFDKGVTVLTFLDTGLHRLELKLPGDQRVKYPTDKEYILGVAQVEFLGCMDPGFPVSKPMSPLLFELKKVSLEGKILYSLPTMVVRR